MSARQIIDLGGTWRFRLDPRDFGEHFPDELNITHTYDARWMGVDYDDAKWNQIQVPACWQTEGYAYNGIAWYRTSFPTPINADQSKRVWLQFDGVDYFADVWLNGRYLGSHEGFFGGFDFDITPYLQAKNQLTVRVDSPRNMPGEENEIGQLKTIFKGALERWDVNDSEVSPGGIWNDVKLVVTGPIRIERMKIQAHPLSLPPMGTPDTPVEAHLMIEAELSLAANHSPTETQITFSIAPTEDAVSIFQKIETITLLPGHQTARFEFKLSEMHLWWTWDLGKPNLYKLYLTIGDSGSPQDQIEQIFGVRKIERRAGWETYLNNVRFFQRGANYLSDQFLSLMTPERYATDIKLLKEANLNTVHPFCVVEKQEFYDQCDSAGLLVYQDFPIWLMASNTSNFVRRAMGQAKEMIRQFGHHPSIGIWTYGSQPSRANFEKLCSALVTVAQREDPTRIIHQANALFAFKEHHDADSQRSFRWLPEYGIQVQQSYDWRLDCHLYFGWYEDEFTDLRNVPKEWLQLITEYGAQSFPKRSTLESFIDPEGLFPPDWPQYARRCSQIKRQIERVSLSEDLDQYIAATQEYQAKLVRYHTEFYRRHKFRPCNGAHVFCFNDCWPAITWALVEYDRKPKKAYYALQQSMAPLQVFLDRDELEPVVGQSQMIPLCAVNDFPYEYPGGIVYCEITGPDSEVNTTELHCDIPAVSIVDLDPIAWKPEKPGNYIIKLTYHHQDKTLAENSYSVVVNA